MKNTRYDIVFIGHVCFDEIVPFEGETTVSPGSAVLCGAMAAAGAGRRVAVVTKMAPRDESILAPMKNAGVDVHVVPAAETSYMQVIHPTADVDVRRMFHRHNAGFFRIDEVPAFDAACIHLAGICDREFDLPLVRGLRTRGASLSADMQSFVRQVDSVTREVRFRDPADKEALVGLLDRVKLDIVEAKIMTGSDDIKEAAAIVQSWGSPEVMITQSAGVLLRVGDATHYEPFSNRSIVGRTGRGDTTFAAYLSRRREHGPAESLKFAAALVSIKMETPGPFRGTLSQVLTRMKEAHHA